ncbi:MAG: peptide chain release factor N(5)-glutamine methyltransferase [Actinobacteria bacterium]|nr:peptide chain release factor N(5)-glutamine methyltransferase [Actinomycetota bacterium]
MNAGVTRPTSAGPSLQDLLSRHRVALAAAGVPSPDADARWLAQHVLGREALRSSRPVPVQAAARLAALVEQRCRRVPLQHLIGSTGFRHVQLSVRPGVFVPRPETEIVTGHAIELLASAAGSTRTAVDACTGSGAIAVCLATELDGVRVVATDSSADAVALCRHNVASLRTDFGSGSEAEVVLGHLLEGVDPELEGHLDLLVSNPPYLGVAELDALDPEVRLHDPPAALAAGPDGYELVIELLELASTWLRPGGAVVLEIAHGRGAEAAERARAVGMGEVEVHPDLSGRERVLVARRTC